MKKLILLISFLTVINTFAQTSFWKADLTTGEYGLMQTNLTLISKNNILKGSSSPNAHKRILGGLKASLAKSMFQADGSIIELVMMYLPAICCWKRKNIICKALKMVTGSVLK